MHSFAAAAPSRFAGIRRWPARIILLFLLILSVQGLSGPSSPAPAAASETAAEEEHADVLLYERVIEGLRTGGSYHEVAAREHREGRYPLRPFVTVRLPTLAWIHAALPPVAPAILFYVLVTATLGAWAWQLSLGGLPMQRAALGAMLLLSGAATLLIPELIVWHECWAALLIALSLALRTDRRYALAAVAALAAALVREQAALFAVVMLCFSLGERRVREAGVWAFVLVAAGVFIAWHARQVAAVTSLDDAASPGWAGTGGWEAAVMMVQITGPLRLMPEWVGAVAVPVALVGWAGWASGNGARGAAFLWLYLMLLGAMARPDNFYWAFLIAPLLPVGLLFAPRALADLIRSALGRDTTQMAPAPLST